MWLSRSLFFSLIRKNIKSYRPKSIRYSSTNIIASDLKDVEIPQVSFPQFLTENFEKFSNFTATECAKTGRKFTYGELLKNAKNLSKALRKKMGLNEGDVVAILLPNIPEYPLIALGIMNGGMIVTTMNPIYTHEEIYRQLLDSGAKILITTVSLWNTASAASNMLRTPIPIITVKTENNESLPRSAIDLFELCETPVDFPDFLVQNTHSVTILPYSSGTTGLPKGVQLTHFNLVANICQANTDEMDFIRDATETHQDIVPVVLPMFHIYGFTVNTFMALCKGAKIVTMSRFTPDEYVKMLRDYDPSVLFLVPPIILFLAGHDMVKKEDFKRVKSIMSGAAPLGKLDEQRLIEKVGNKDLFIRQGYGLTETSPVVTAIAPSLKARVEVGGSIGKPISNTSVKVVAPDDATGTPLGPNVQGELLVKGPQLMKGYLNKPEETEKTFLDGWLRTGDMVYYNENQVIFVTDRLKELIKVKGFQVAPAELEEIIRDFPGVDDAAVIGVNHPTLGEAPRAYVVPKKGSKVNVGDLQEFVKKKVAEYKKLVGGVELVEVIPKNASGKILRRMLKLEYENKK